MIILPEVVCSISYQAAFELLAKLSSQQFADAFKMWLETGHYASRPPGEVHGSFKVNIGLHHLALSVESFEQLDAIHEKIKVSGINIEFSPELLRAGPSRHMMCYEPSGIRIEFICVEN